MATLLDSYVSRWLRDMGRWLVATWLEGKVTRRLFVYVAKGHKAR